MGQLQQALLVVGALIIAAVVAFNLWQSWQLRRRRPRSEGAARSWATSRALLRPRCAKGAGTRW